METGEMHVKKLLDPWFGSRACRPARCIGAGVVFHDGGVFGAAWH
jgi:hypothetical protein